MSNNVASNLSRAQILSAAMAAFKKRLITLRSIFSTVYSATIQENNAKVIVPYYPLATGVSAARTPGQSYLGLAQDSETQSKEITINRNLVQGIKMTNEEQVRNRWLDPVQLGAQAGHKLARDIMADIFGVFTVANFPGATLDAISADDYDYASALELKTLCDNADWPAEMRSLILKPEYHEGLLLGAPTTLRVSPDDPQYRDGMVSRAAGFGVYDFPSLPENGERLKGLAVYPSAVLVAFAPVEPTPAIRAQLFDYEVLEDEETGITLEYKHLADADTGQEGRFIESHYGFAVGEAAAAKRIVAPAP